MSEDRPYEEYRIKFPRLDEEIAKDEAHEAGYKLGLEVAKALKQALSDKQQDEFLKIILDAYHKAADKEE